MPEGAAGGVMEQPLWMLVPWAVGRHQFKIIASEANDYYSAEIGRARILHDSAQILLDKNGNTLRHSR